MTSPNPALVRDVEERRTFAIISHPDAGKTTLTEKLLLFGGAIQMAGAVKGRKANRHATSDWMEVEKERGISVTSSVMQFKYANHVINLLDTPGHEDFSEDTYRVLTAVDAAIMVIDAAKGVEAQTIKLLEVCRLRKTPIITFINKFDREVRSPLDLLSEIESILKLQCVPITWPIGMGKTFRGVFSLLKNQMIRFTPGADKLTKDREIIEGLENPKLDRLFPMEMPEARESIELVEGATEPFSLEKFLSGDQSPVFFGSGVNNFGVQDLLDALVNWAPSPRSRQTTIRTVEPTEPKFTGFVFKIQANMDPKHRDRIAFMRLVSGEYKKGMKMRHVRIGRDVQISDAVTFMAGERDLATEAVAGDIIGIHNHGTIRIGDTFTEGEELRFSGIPNFAPELFRRIRLKDPLKQKQLLKGLVQLSEEGAVQVFRPLINNDLIVGAVGVLQFDVVVSRLKHEYNVDATYENVNVTTARWIECDDPKALEEFKDKVPTFLALDGGDNLTYLATSGVNLNLAMERYPKVKFLATREH